MNLTRSSLSSLKSEFLESAAQHLSITVLECRLQIAADRNMPPASGQASVGYRGQIEQEVKCRFAAEVVRLQ